MTNNDYIVVKEDGWYVGGVKTTSYHDKPILPKDYMRDCPFYVLKAEIKMLYGFDLLEYHCLQSSTAEISEGEEPLPSEDGVYSYLRIVYKNQENEIKTTEWGFVKEYDDAQKCLWDLYFNCSGELSSGGESSLKHKLLGEELPQEERNSEDTEEWLRCVDQYRSTFGGGKVVNNS